MNAAILTREKLHSDKVRRNFIMKKMLRILAAIMSVLLIPAMFAACSTEEQVTDPVFTLDKTSVDLTAGGNVEVLTLTIANLNETPEWASSNSSVATVSVGSSANKATVKGVGAGAAVITVKAGANLAICAVTVKPGAYINLDKTSVSLLAGTTTTLSVETNVTSSLTYTSSNPSVATVSPTGLITAVSGGVAKITVSGGNASATCTVIVTDPYVVLNKEMVLLTLEEGQNTFQLEADSNGDVEWYSDNEDAVTVSEEGLVTAVAKGEATITASYASASALCVVKVKEEILTVTIFNEGVEVEDTLTLQPKSSLALTATITPEQQDDDAKVTWSVKSGETVVSVDENGVVTSLGDIYGTAVIVATSVKDPDCTAECTVNVPDPYADWLVISDKASLVAAFKSGNENKNMYLTGDIDFDGATLNSSMGNFNGTFDGRGYEIMNFSCNGLFGGVDRKGTVRNLAITCTSGRGAEFNGLFGQFVLGKVENCRFDITVNENNMATIAHHTDRSSVINNVIMLVRNPLNKENIYAGCFLNGAWSNSYCAVLEGKVAQVFGPQSKTEAELKQASLYADWDGTVWQIEDGEIPVLKNGGNIGELRVVLNTTAETIYKGSFLDLVATVKPTKLPVADKGVIWSSDNEDVATVDQNGSVTAVGEGIAVITATSVKDDTKFASCTITVELPDTQPEPIVEITNKSAVSEGLKINNSLTLTTRVNRDDGSVSWSSSDSGVASVDDSGKVTAKGEGEVTITATFTTENGKIATDSVTITVYGDGYIELALRARSVSVGGTYKIDFKALGGTVNWTSSNPHFATVDASGTVNGIAVGKTTITAKVGDKTATMVIQVYDKPAGATEVSTPAQFKNIGNGTYFIVNDIDMGGETVNTLNEFAKINGLGYKVSNFSTPKLFTQFQGYMRNIEISCVLNGNGNFDGLFGTWIGAADGTVENCILDITFSGSANQCALVHHNNNGTVRNIILKVTCENGASGQKFPAWFEKPGNGNVENIFLLKGKGTYSATNGATEKTEAQLKSASTFDESWDEGWVIIDGQLPVLKGALVTEPLKIKLDKTTAELFVGETETLTATVTPTELTEEERAIKWISSDTKIATVANGVITAVKDGTVTVKAISVNDETVFATCTVTVTAIEISINNEDKISELKLNGAKQLNATVNCGKYEWETSDSSVATVTDGLVTAVGAGTVTITVRSENDPTKFDSITIEVKTTIVITVEISETSLSLDRDDTATLTVTVGNSDSGVTWTSDNESVATVDENGKVTTHGADGTATITATSKDDDGNGNHTTATCIVTVTYVPVEIELKAQNFNLFTGGILSVSEIAEASKGELTLSVVSGSDVVSIENGKVTATGEGTATVRVTSSISYDDVTAVYEEVEITVVEAKVAISINVEKRSLHVGGSGNAWTLEVTLDPMPASPAASDVVWTSSNPSAISVVGGFSDGKYTGKLTTSAVGKATITATRTVDGIDYTVTCEVNAFTAQGSWRPVDTPDTLKTITVPGTNWYLANDLDFADIEITSNYLGNMDSVHLDGRGYSIKNIKTNFTDREAGFISILVGLTVVENVNFIGFDINGSNSFMYGGLIRQIDGSASIRNCYFEGTISARGTGNEAYIGSIGAKFGGGVIENCVFNVGLGDVAPNSSANSNPRIMVARWIGGEVKNCIAFKDAVSSPVHAAPGDGFSADKYASAFKTEEQIKTAATFDGWTAWVAVDGELPRLVCDWEE